MIENEEYFLAFGFGENHAELRHEHMTLKYLGKINCEGLRNLMRLVQEYFDVNKPRSFYINFNQEDMFGSDGTIRVLRPAKEFEDVYPLMRLRRQLDAFKKDDYLYNPHINVSHNDCTGFVGKINKLYLCKKSYRVVAKWDLI